jgi:O-antigen ligase
LPETETVSESVKSRLTPAVLLTALCMVGFLFFLRLMFPMRVRVAMYAAGLGLTLLLMVPRPRVWLYFLPFILFMAGAPRFHLGEFHPTLASSFIVLFTVWYLFDRCLWNRRIFVPSPTLYLCLFALLLQVASAFISFHHHGQYTTNAIREAAGAYQSLPLLVMVPVLLGTQHRMRAFLRVLTIAVLFVSLSAVLEYHSIGSFSRMDMSIGYVYRGRVSGFFRHPNVLAGFFELGTPLVLGLFFSEGERRWKVLALVTVVLSVFATLYTFSRGGLLFLTVGCSITLFWRFRKRLLLPIVLLVGFVLILLFSADVFSRQMSFFTDPQGSLTEPTILHRVITYRGFINQFLSSPLTGLGWGAQSFYWGRTLLYSFWEGRHAVSDTSIMDFGGLNSMLLNQAVKGGLVSLTAMLLVFLSALVAFIRAFRRRHGMLAVGIYAGLLGFYGHQLVENGMRWPMTNAAFWLSMGLLAALGSMGPSEAGRGRAGAAGT